MKKVIVPLTAAILITSALCFATISVDHRTGNPTVSVWDHDIPTPGGEFPVHHVYVLNTSGELGPDWLLDAAWSIAMFSDELLLLRRGTEEVFLSRSGASQMYRAGGVELEKSGSGWTARFAGGTTSVFDPSGREISRSDKSGAGLEFAYNQFGRLARIESSGGPALVLEYSHSGQLKSIMSEDGRVCAFVYDMNGRLAESRDADNRITSYGYLPDGKLVRVTYPGGETVTLKYNLKGRIKQVSSSSGVSFDYTYGMVSRTTCSNAFWWEVEHDRSGFPSIYRDSMRRQGAWSWNTSGRISACTFPDRSTASYRYDSSGRLVKQSTREGGTLSISYQGAANPRKIDIDDTEIQLAYNADGALQSIESPRGSLTFTYDDYGQVVESIDEFGSTFRIKGAASPGEKSFGGIDPARHHATGNSMGRLFPTPGMDQEAVRLYDKLGRVIETHLSNGMTATTKFGPDGKLDHVGDGQNAVRIIGDITERELKIGDCYGGMTTLSTDRAGNVVERKFPRGGVEQRSYDQFGRLQTLTLPMGNEYSFFHDASGRVKEVMFPRVGSLRLLYDTFGRVSSITYPWAGINHFEYSPSGLLTRKTNARGQAVEFAYDSRGRLVAKKSRGGTCTYTYNADGKLTRARNQELTIDYSYDTAGRLIKTEYIEWGKAVQYVYDEVGRLSTLIGPGGNRIGYVYDELGRVFVVNASAGCSFEFSYDDNGRLRQRSCSNGVTTRYGYDVEGRVESIHHTDSFGKTLAKRLYTYDLEGNRSEVIDEKVGRTSYLYDEESRMTSEDNAGGWNKYVFGPGGNRVWVSRMSGSDTYGYDDWGRLNKSNEQSLEYDLDGNLSRRRDGSATTRYIYDAENRLTRVELPRGRVIEYGYGPLGRKIRREENGSRTYYLYDGFHVFQELRGDLEIESTYSYAGFDTPLAALSSTGRIVFFHQDILGSLIAVSDSNGRLLARYIYDAFGKVVEEVWQELDYPPRFAGRPLEPASGLYDMRDRYYDPDVGLYIMPGRYLGSIDDPATLSPYVYAKHNPLRFVEPTGQFAVEARLHTGEPRSWSENSFVDSFVKNPTGHHISAERLASTPSSTALGNFLDTVERCFEEQLTRGGYNPGDWKLRNDAYVALMASARRSIDRALGDGGVFRSANSSYNSPAQLGLNRTMARVLPWRWSIDAKADDYGMRSRKLSPVIDERLPVSGIPPWEQRSYASAAETENTLRQHYPGALSHVVRKARELESTSDATKDAARDIEKAESKVADKREEAAEKLDDILELASELQEVREEKYLKIQELDELDPKRRKERRIDVLQSLLEEIDDKMEDMQSKLDDISEMSQEAESRLAPAAERAPEVAPALQLRREILARLHVLKEFEGPEGEATRLEEDVIDIDLGPRLAHNPMARAVALISDMTEISKRAEEVLGETRESYDAVRDEIDSLDP